MSEVIEKGYTKVEMPEGTHFSDENQKKRLARIAPTDPQPVPGGFVPLNNVFERI